MSLWQHLKGWAQPTLRDYSTHEETMAHLSPHDRAMVDQGMQDAHARWVEAEQAQARDRFPETTLQAEASRTLTPGEQAAAILAAERQREQGRSDGQAVPETALTQDVQAPRARVTRVMAVHAQAEAFRARRQTQIDRSAPRQSHGQGW